MGFTILFILIIGICVYFMLLYTCVMAKIAKAEACWDALEEAEETEVEAACQAYNEAAETYNQAITQFPGLLAAGMFGFKKMDTLS